MRSGDSASPVSCAYQLTNLMFSNFSIFLFHEEVIKSNLELGLAATAQERSLSIFIQGLDNKTGQRMIR